MSSLTMALALQPGVNYTRPLSVVGVNDQAFVNTLGLDADMQMARNHVLMENLTPGVRELNVFWSSFEVTHSTPEPEACAEGYMQVPADESGLAAHGGLYAAYHCYSIGSTQQLQTSLRIDAASGLQMAAVLWCTAVPYRDSLCLGQPEAAVQSAPEDAPPGYTQFVQRTDARVSQLQVSGSIAPVAGAETQSATDVAGCSCVPTVDSYPDFQDYVTFLAHNLSTPDAHITHWIVLNEVQSALWTDLSPRIDVTKDVDAASLRVWQNFIIDVMNLARNALWSTPYPVMIYTSIDRYWGPAPTLQLGLGRTHIGGKAVVDALLFAGPLLDFNWSLGVHVYGDPVSDELDAIPAAYNYITLNAISQYLDFQLKVVKKTGSVLMAATEQGLQASQNDNAARAQWICQAHNITLTTPNLLFSAHNDFAKLPGASDDFSLVVSSDPLMADAETILEYQAYRSTALTTWNLNNGHYCCVQHALGCAR